MKRFAAIAILSLMAACSAASATSATRVELGEFHIGVGAEVWSAGAVDLAVVNTGEFGHTLVITDGDGHVVGAGDLIQPGDEVAFSIELAPGNYQLSCRIVIETGDGTIVDHFQEGMSRNVVVTG